MKTLMNLTTSLVERVNRLISRAAEEHPGMPEVAAMVYVGDVYVLREQAERRQSDGWGRHSYVADGRYGDTPLRRDVL